MAMRLKCVSFLVLITPLSHAAKKPNPPTPEEAKEYVISRLQAVGGESRTSSDEDGARFYTTELTRIALTSCTLSYVEQKTQDVTITIAGQEPH
jgi:hypothetical protein